MATAITTCLTLSTSSSQLSKARPNDILHSLPLSSSPSFIRFARHNVPCSLALSVSFAYSCRRLNSNAASSTSSPLWLNPFRKTRFPAVLPIFQQEEETLALTETPGDRGSEEDPASNDLLRSCKLYVCNLPRSFDIPELLNMFKPFGTVLAVEVSRNSETGISRGCGYVTMSSIYEAKAALSALDGCDVNGRELRVRFSVEMSKGRSNFEALNSGTRRIFVFESPYKIYVGNLAWSVKPADVKYLFSQFGTVVSATVVHNHSAGKRRNYGFLTFSSASERDAAISLNGTEFCGRTLIVREVLKQDEP